MIRANALRALYAVLEANTALTTKLNHTVGATKLSQGAKIIGHDVFLENIEDKLPMLILRIPRNIPTANNPLRDCIVPIEVVGRDVFETSEVIDLLEAAVEGYRANLFPNLPSHINTMQLLEDDETSNPDPLMRLPVAQVSIRIRFIKK